MRAPVFCLALLFPLFLAAQKDTLRSNDSLSGNSVERYFSSYGLNPDSAETPYLFYYVYDWLGTKYHYGGCSKNGVDCSGFVGSVYRDVYCIPLAGGSKQLFSMCDSVPRSEMKEGDILFFKIRKGQISHVGVYLGHNKFVHASVHGGVMVDDLSEPYYRKYFYRAGRLK